MGFAGSQSFTDELRAEGHAFRLFPREDGALVLGRRATDGSFTPDIDLYDLVDSRTVSREQGYLWFENGGWSYEAALGTLNPTVVNGEELEPGQRIALHDEDELQIGRIEVRSGGWMPALDLQELRLIDARGREALRLPHRLPVEGPDEGVVSAHRLVEAAAHRLEARGADQLVGVLRQRHVDRHDVGASEEIVEVHGLLHARRQLPGMLDRDRRVVAEHVHEDGDGENGAAATEHAEGDADDEGEREAGEEIGRGGHAREIGHASSAGCHRFGA